MPLQIKTLAVVFLLNYFFYLAKSDVKMNVKRIDADKMPFVLPPLRIIGGQEVTPHEYPYMAGIFINGNAFCGGSLISQNYVLTAAHCGIVIYTAEVILGAHNYKTNETGQVRIQVTEVSVHENFNEVSFENDIALIKLSEPVEFTDYIQPVVLPSSSDDPIDDQLVTAIGWGLTQDIDNPTVDDTSDVLMNVNVSVINLQSCKDYYNNNEYNITFVTDKNICTSGYKNRGTCNGDSGGPLISDGIQVGLTSIGTTQCEWCTPSIFTNVVNFVDWILEHSDVNTLTK